MHPYFVMISGNIVAIQERNLFVMSLAKITRFNVYVSFYDLAPGESSHGADVHVPSVSRPYSIFSCPNTHNTADNAR